MEIHENQWTPQKLIENQKTCKIYANVFKSMKQYENRWKPNAHWWKSNAYRWKWSKSSKIHWNKNKLEKKTMQIDENQLKINEHQKINEDRWKSININK